MEYNSIDQFLQTFEDSVESSGSFSLNLDAARKKLKSFQLPDPGLYPIFLVAAAVASDARRFDVWTGADELRFEFDGSPFSEAELEGLDGYLFASDDVPARLQNLAIALSAAGEMATSLEFRSGTACLRRTGEVNEVSTAAKIVKTRVVVPRPKKTFLRSFKDKTPNLKETLSVCRFAPLSIRFNDTFPSWGWSFRRPLIHRTLTTDRRIGFPPSAYDCHKQEAQSPGPFGGVIALVEDENPRDLLVVVHGVSHPIPIDSPHMEGVLWHDGLTRDLSCTQLVHNQEMKQFLAQLKGQIAGMVLERVGSQAAFRSDDRAMLEPLAEQAAAHFREVGAQDSAERLEQWVLADDLEAPDIVTDEGYQVFRSQLNSLGDAPRSVALRARALELFLEQIKRLGKEFNWGPLEVLIGRMRPLYTPPNADLESLAQLLSALNREERLEIQRSETRGEDHFQEGLVSLLIGDWEQAEPHLLKAADSNPREANVVLVHAYLGRDNPRSALQAAEKAMSSATSLERYLAEQPDKEADVQRHKETNAVYRDLVADCFLATGRTGEALDMRISALTSKPKDLKLHSMRLQNIYRMGRGQWPFLEGVKWRLRALRAEWNARDGELPYYCPSRERKKLEECWKQLESYLSHRPQRLDVEPLFQPRFLSYERTKYYLDQVAREMRLRGESRVAERLIVRLALTQKAKALCDRIVFGAKEG